MGEVYRAHDKETGMVVAIKRMLVEAPEGADESAQYHAQRFEEECKLLKSLSYPGIPTFVESFQDENRSVIVMEFIEGVDLEKQVIDQLGLTGENLPVTIAVEYTIQVAKILEYLHAHRPRPIVHRDVKPANIIVRASDNRLYLVDFGLAREVGGGASTKTAVGTVGYAPLEQYRGRPTTRTDQYSLGVTLHFMLSGQQPVPLQIEPLDKLRKDLPHELCWIVRKATQTEQEDRFDSVYEFRRELEKLLPTLSNLEEERVLAAQAQERLALMGPTEELANAKPAQRVKIEGVHVPAPDPMADFGVRAPIQQSAEEHREFQQQALQAARASQTVAMDDEDEHRQGRQFPLFAALVLVLGVLLLFMLNAKDQERIARRILADDSMRLLGKAGLYWQEELGGIGRQRLGPVEYVLCQPLPRHDGIWFENPASKRLQVHCKAENFPLNTPMVVAFLDGEKHPQLAFFVQATKLGLRAARLDIAKSRTLDFNSEISIADKSRWLTSASESVVLPPSRGGTVPGRSILVLVLKGSGITLDLDLL